MVFLKFNKNLIIDEMDMNKLLEHKSLKNINKNKELIAGLLIIKSYLCQEWYTGGITLKYLENFFAEYLEIINPALDFVGKNLKTRKFIDKFVKEHKIRFTDI